MVKVDLAFLFLYLRPEAGINYFVSPLGFFPRDGHHPSVMSSGNICGQPEGKYR